MAHDDVPARGLADQIMRQALLRELEQPPESNDSPTPATKLEQITRRFLAKAGEGDLAAIRDVYDRVDGKTVSGIIPVEEAPKPRLLKWID